MRELPRGAMSRTEATLFVVLSSLVFVFASWNLSTLCAVLSPLALAIVFWYSLAKRYTSYTQAFLGLAMAVAPVGGWLAAGGRRGWSRGCSAPPSDYGLADSTCSTRARIWPSIARMAFIRSLCDTACRDRY